MKKKILLVALIVCFILPCVFMFSACVKKKQANTLAFAGAYQSAKGDVYLQIDNIDDYDVNVYLECTFDGGNSWQQATNETVGAKRTVKAKEYADDIAGSTLSIGVRLGETYKLKASKMSDLIEYKVKPVCEVKEVFYDESAFETQEYTESKIYGITAFKFIKQADSSFKVEKFNQSVDAENEFIYHYTFAESNWDKNTIKFEYKFVTFNEAFDERNYLSITNLKEYEDVISTTGWVDYNANTGIVKENYNSHIEELEGVGIMERFFVVLIRVKGNESNLCSECTPVFVKVEDVELPTT